MNYGFELLTQGVDKLDKTSIDHLIQNYEMLQELFE